MIIKLISGKDKKYMNPDALSNVVQYIYNGVIKLPPRQQIWGCIGVIHDSDPDSIIHEMISTKKDYALCGGVQCKHFMVSLGNMPKLKRKQIIKKIRKMLMLFSDKYQIFYGVHYKINEFGWENYHIHIMLNSIDMNRKRKISITKQDLSDFKKRVWKIWSKV